MHSGSLQLLRRLRIHGQHFLAHAYYDGYHGRFCCVCFRCQFRPLEPLALVREKRSLSGVDILKPFEPFPIMIPYQHRRHCTPADGSLYSRWRSTSSSPWLTLYQLLNLDTWMLFLMGSQALAISPSMYSVLSSRALLRRPSACPWLSLGELEESYPCVPSHRLTGRIVVQSIFLRVLRMPIRAIECIGQETYPFLGICLVATALRESGRRHRSRNILSG